MSNFQDQNVSDISGAGDVRAGVNRLGRDFEQIGGDVRGLARDAAGAARSGVLEVKRGLMRTVSAARRTGQQAADSAKETLSTHPLASVGVALGVGLLLGIVLARRR